MRKPKRGEKRADPWEGIASSVGRARRDEHELLDAERGVGGGARGSLRHGDAPRRAILISYLFAIFPLYIHLYNTLRYNTRYTQDKLFSIIIHHRFFTLFSSPPPPARLVVFRAPCCAPWHRSPAARRANGDVTARPEFSRRKIVTSLKERP